MYPALFLLENIVLGVFAGATSKVESSVYNYVCVNTKLFPNKGLFFALTGLFVNLIGAIQLVDFFSLFRSVIDFSF